MTIRAELDERRQQLVGQAEEAERIAGIARARIYEIDSLVALLDAGDQAAAPEARAPRRDLRGDAERFFRENPDLLIATTDLAKRMQIPMRSAETAVRHLLGRQIIQEFAGMWRLRPQEPAPEIREQDLGETTAQGPQPSLAAE